MGWQKLNKNGTFSKAPKKLLDSYFSKPISATTQNVGSAWDAVDGVRKKGGGINLLFWGAIVVAFLILFGFLILLGLQAWNANTTLPPVSPELQQSMQDAFGGVFK